MENSEEEEEMPVTYAMFWMQAYGKDWRKKREEELKKQREEMSQNKGGKNGKR